MDDLTTEIVTLLSSLEGYSRAESVMRLRALAAIAEQIDTASLLRFASAMEDGAQDRRAAA